MIGNYFKIALRNLIRQKGYSFINIAGLAIGVACCILITLYVTDELGYDRHHEKAERVYRIILRGMLGTNEFNQTVTCAPLGETLVCEFPEVEVSTRFRSYGFPVIRYQDKVFSEEKFFWADSSFFDVFTVPFILGNPKTALTQPNTVVLTRSTAKKYFGDENPLGKQMNADNLRDYLVTGVVEDVPHNSHLHFDFLASLMSYAPTLDQTWINNNFCTYIVLRDGADPAKVQSMLPDLVSKYVGPQVQEALGVSFESLKETGNYYGYFLQPLTDIHLHSDLDFEIEPNGNATYVYIFSIIAGAILLIACINFMNLATARSASRAKEVGIRKTLGSERAQLIRQFLSESVFTSFLSIILALFIVELLLPMFNELAGKQLDIHYFDNPTTVPALLGLGLIVGLLAGSYPAFFLASFKPVAVLKGTGKVGPSRRSPLLRSGLVIAQFTISIILFIGTFVVRDQLHFIQNKRLGFNKEQVIVVEKTDDLFGRIVPFMDELRQKPRVLQVSNSNNLPGQNFGSSVHRMADAGGEETHLIWNLRTDYDFAATYEIEMAAGRYFSRDWSTDSAAVVINETAARVLGTGDPVGKTLINVGPRPDLSQSHTIIGVARDFHFESLHQQIRPLAIKLFNRNNRGRFVSVRIAAEDISNTVSTIENTWHKFAGNQAFEYIFFDQEFGKLYESEQRTGKILTVFSALAIFIACLGLLGLASFTTEQRTKEIGIRKVMGASIANVVLLLSKEFTKWVLLANIVAWPLAYLAMNNWLQNFAYRINIPVWVFPAAAATALLIALLTVSYQTLRAALSNPVEALRYE